MSAEIANISGKILLYGDNMNIQSQINEARNLLNKYSKKLTEQDKSALTPLVLRLERIKELSSRTRFKLVFIGSVGAGKTTAICHWLGLLDDTPIGKLPNAITTLKTSSSRTTSAEVRLTNDISPSRIEIIPYKLQEQIKLVENYCRSVWGEHFLEEIEDEPDKKSDSSIEIQNIIHNMIGCKDAEEFENIISDENFTEFESFKDYVLNKINLPNRIKKNATVYTGTNNFKKWLQKEFRNTNDGLDGWSIPRCIKINVNPKVLDLHFPSFVSEIIDTKGVNTETKAFAREDLQNYIRMDNVIPVVIDSFAKMPDTLFQHIFTSWIIKEDRDIIPRSIALIRHNTTELGDMNGAEGNPEEGERLKRIQFKSLIRQNRLNFLVDNAIFYDAKFGVETTQKITESNGKPISRTVVSNLNEEWISFNSRHLTEQLEGVLERYKKFLSSDADNVAKQINDIFSNIRNQHSERFEADKNYIVSKLTELKTNKLKEINSVSAVTDFSISYSCYLRNTIHWNTMSKTTAMYGGWPNANIYYLASEYLRANLMPLFVSLKSKIDGLWSFSNDEELLSLCVGYNELSLVSFSNMLSTIEKRIRLVIMQRFYENCESFEQNDYPNLAFWNIAQNTRRGTGYFDRLIETYKNWLKFPTIDKVISEIVKCELDSYMDTLISAIGA